MSNDPYAVPPATTSDFERPTRRVGRTSALVLGLSILLPRAATTRGKVVFDWFWEPSSELNGRAALSWEESLPRVLVWLGVASAAWWAAALHPLVRRGRWLTLAPATCLAVAATDRDTFEGGGGVAWPLGWPFHAMLLGALGLILARTRAHRSLGRAMCAFGGVVLIGMLFFPADESTWLFWSSVFKQGLGAHGVLPMQLNLLLWLSLGPLLLWIGLRRTYSRSAPVLVACVLALAVGTSIITSQLALMNVGEDDRAWWHAPLVVFNGLRLQLRAWCLVCLLATGLLAWIVGAREGQPLESVFD